MARGWLAHYTAAQRHHCSSNARRERPNGTLAGRATEAALLEERILAQISASVRRSGARAKGRIASANNALTAKNHGPVQLNRDNDYIRMD
ncbi:hypothetical protein ALP12_05021 [Pseudomonas savastanoi pv. phaseolicola]|nr:hypothetical protein ALP12_05021 [Pseudomonas savastanoi pv. phaseolicola]